MLAAIVDFSSIFSNECTALRESFLRLLTFSPQNEADVPNLNIWFE
jgi:hypothetical protein